MSGGEAAAAWGSNYYGQLGLGSASASQNLTIPVPVDHTGVLASRTIAHVSAGSHHACALTTDGLLACWGRNLEGQLGDGSKNNAQVPVWVDTGTNSSLKGKTIASVSAGFKHTCAVTTDGIASCWGSNGYKGLGTGLNTAEVLLPTAVDASGVLKGKKVTSLSTGHSATCATIDDGSAACWGKNTDGELGLGEPADPTKPVNQSAVPALVDRSGAMASASIAAISIGAGFTCATTTVGAPFCWGTNYSGGLGGGVVSSRSPVAVDTSGVLAGKKVTSISVGDSHACALADDATLACWGGNNYGQIGDGTDINRAAPVAVDMTSSALAGTTVTEVSVGMSHTCAVATGGVTAAACWGLNFNGQVGDGTKINRSLPTRVLLVGPVHNISAGDTFTVSAVPPLLPTAPSSLVAATVNGPATVSFDAGLPNGPEVTTYQYSTDDGATWADVVPASPATKVQIPGLAANTDYQVRVRGVNSEGPGAPSAAVTVSGPRAPDAPTALKATAGDGWARISFTPGGDRGSAITGYEYSTDDGATWNAANPQVKVGPLTIWGLTVNTTYTIRVRALNAVGEGGASASVSATPVFGPLYSPVEPARLLDTRPGGETIDGNGSHTKLGANTTLNLTVVGRGPVPGDGVGAVALNVTSTGATQPTYVTVFPKGEARPTSSNLNVDANQTVPNMVIAKVGANGQVSIYNAAGATDIVVDVLGWLPAASAYAALSPVRLADTRPATQTVDGLGPRGIVGPGQTVPVKVTGRGPVPTSGVGAVVLNVTSTGATAPTFVTAFPQGEARPLSSNVNAAIGQTVPNLVIAKVGANGEVAFYNAAGSTHLVVDIMGWFPVASDYTPLTPARLVDTRPGNGGQGGLLAGQTMDVEVTGRGGVPASGVGAVVLNVTSTGATDSTFITAFPAGSARPLASNLNVPTGRTVANLVIAKVGKDGKVSFYNVKGTTNLVVDVLGWVAEPKG